MLGQQHYKPKYNGRLCYTQPPIYVEKNMIYDSTKELLSIAIKEYDKLAGKEFLIGCSISKNHDTEYMVLQINRHNFWHLLGCQLDKSKLKERSLDIYDMCIKGEPIQEYLIYTKDYASSTQKKDPFLSVFNFVEKAKQIRISNTKDTPDYCKFKLVHGNACGIIGYDNDKNTKDPNTYIPKTTILMVINVPLICQKYFPYTMLQLFLLPDPTHIFFRSCMHGSCSADHSVLPESPAEHLCSQSNLAFRFQCIPLRYYSMVHRYSSFDHYCIHGTQYFSTDYQDLQCCFLQF